MRTFVFRLFLSIAFVGVVGTVAAKEYSGGNGLARVAAPAGCASTVECGAVCAAQPQSCFNYCEADAAHAVECGRWAKAYHAAGGVTIAQTYAPPPDSSGGSINTSPSSGASGGTSGSVMGSPMGSPFVQPGQPQPGGDQPMMGGMGMGGQAQQGMMSGQPNMMQGGQQGMMGQPGTMGGPGMQTCNVNGVEVHGRCEDVEKQTRKPMGIPLGGGLSGTGPGGCASPEQCKAFCEKSENQQSCGGFFQNFQSAPRDFQTREPSRPEFQQQAGQNKEEFDKQRQEGEERFAKEQEAQQQRVQEQMLRQMKQGMKQMTRMVSEMERRIAGLVKRKVKIPDEITSAMTQLKELVVQAQNITEPEEMGEIGPQIGELVQTINDQFGSLERLAEFPRVIAQANRMVKQMEGQLKRLEARIKARKIDVGEALTEARATLDSIKSAVEAAKVAAAQGDAEAAFEQLQSGVFERGDEIGEKFVALEMIVQAPQIINQKTRELRTVEARIRQLERAKKDMTEAKALLTQAKTKFEECKTLVKARPLVIEDLMACTEEFENLMDELRTSIGENNVPEFKPFELQLPAGIPVAPTTSVESTPAAVPVQ